MMEIVENIIQAKMGLKKSINEKVKKIAKLISFQEDSSKIAYFQFPANDYFAEWWIEFSGFQNIEGQVFLDVFMDTEACYILTGVQDDSGVQKKSLEKLLKKKI